MSDLKVTLWVANSDTGELDRYDQFETHSLRVLAENEAGEVVAELNINDHVMRVSEKS